MRRIRREPLVVDRSIVPIERKDYACELLPDNFVDEPCSRTRA